MTSSDSRRLPHLQQAIDAGEVSPPAELGTPELAVELAPDVDSLAGLLIAERDEERAN
jgi:hypothetical protein